MKRKRSQVSHLTTSTTVLSDDYSRIECELKISRIQGKLEGVDEVRG